MQHNIHGWQRLVSVAAGAGLLVAAARTRGASRSLAGLAGLGLIGRGTSGYCPFTDALARRSRRDDTKRALGGPRGVFLRERIVIDAPVDVLYAFWKNPANLPIAMPFLQRVDRLDGTRSHWVVRGPAGSQLEWDAEIINQVPNETIGWQSLAGADVASAGSVHFRPAAGLGTEVTVTMQYAPLAGRLGASISRLLGTEPALEIRRALRQLKQVFEARTAPVPLSSGHVRPGAD